MSAYLAELRLARQKRLANFAAAEAAYRRRQAPAKPAEPPEPQPMICPPPTMPADSAFLPILPRPHWFYFRAGPEPQFRPRISAVQFVVAHYYRTSVERLKSADRQHDITKVRHICFYLARRLTAKSLPEIGRAFGGRDHTTIMHGVSKVEALLQTDRDLADLVDSMEALLTPDQTREQNNV